MDTVIQFFVDEIKFIFSTALTKGLFLFLLAIALFQIFELARFLLKLVYTYIKSI